MIFYNNSDYNRCILYAKSEKLSINSYSYICCETDYE